MKTTNAVTSYMVSVHNKETSNFTGRYAVVEARNWKHAVTVALLRNPIHLALVDSTKEYHVVENRNTGDRHFPVAKTNNQKTDTYELITYDVWGNAEDGYEINQSFTTGKTIDITEQTSDASIKSMVSKRFGKLGPCDIHFLNDDTIQFTDKKDGKPICELQKKA